VVKSAPGQIVPSQIGPKSKRPQNESQIGHIFQIEYKIMYLYEFLFFAERFMHNFIFLDEQVLFLWMKLIND